MDIETKHANLDTLAVTIQALHVNGKQMTLAVFRQLPQCHSPREPEGAQHWGVVRYDIKDQGELWLVYSYENKLYRRALNLMYPKTKPFDLNRVREQLQLAQNSKAAAEARMQREEELRRKTKITRDIPIYERRIAMEKTTISIHAERCKKLTEEIKEEGRWQQAVYDSELAIYNRDHKLSQLPQLFIAV